MTAEFRTVRIGRQGIDYQFRVVEGESVEVFDDAGEPCTDASVIETVKEVAPLAIKFQMARELRTAARKEIK